MGVKRIIICEDERTLAMTLYEVLFSASGNFEVILCEKGEDAWDKIKSRAPDLLITDLRLPGRIDGLELLRRIKEKYSDTKTMLMTAYGTDEVKKNAESLGVVAYYEKPFPLLEFVNKVKEILDVSENSGG